MAIILQVLSTAAISLICLSVGILYTWPSSTIMLFTSPNTTLNRVMTETEVSLLGSLPSISGIIVTPFAGSIIDSLGRKWSCIVLNLAQLACWVIINTCTTPEAILFAVFVFGFSTCVFILVPIYISEICEDSIRGSMISTSMVFYGIGILLSYIMGGLLDYNTMNHIGLSVVVLSLIMFCTMKESPLHLLKIGREQKARESIAFFRYEKITSKVVEDEMEKIKRILNTEVDEPNEEKQELNVKGEKITKKSQWHCLKKSRTAQRGLMICIALFTFSIFQGLIVVQVYAGPLFTEALPSISVTLSSVLFALVAVITSLVATYFMDRVGRRRLMISGSIATGLCAAIFGSQIHIKWGPNWVTAMFIFLYSLAYVIGAGMVPTVIVGEIFMPEVKSLASIIAMEWALVCDFVILFIFNPLVNYLGLGPVFYIFSICCCISAIFSFYFLPETSGLSVDEIQKQIKRPRSKNTKYLSSI